MPVEAITLNFPCCHFPENLDETPSSKAIRITMIVAGTIALLTGVLALCGVPGLNVLGKVGGGSLIALGALAILPAAVFKKVYRIAHFPATGQNHPNPLFYLRDFAKSKEPDNAALQERLKQELHITDLAARLEENGIPENQMIMFMLPLQFDPHNGARNEDVVFEGAKLVYMTRQEILDLPLATLETFDDRQLNLVYGRLFFMKKFSAPTTTAEGTLGALLTETQLLPLSPRLYLFLSANQLGFLIQNLPVTPKFVADLFPLHPSQYHLSWIGTRTAHRIQELHITPLTAILPQIRDSNLLLEICDYRGIEINTSLVSDEQLKILFTSLDAYHFKKIPLALLNRYLPHLSDKQLKKIDVDLLPILDYQPLSPEKVRAIFDDSSHHMTANRLGKLPIPVLNTIRSKLTPEHLKLLDA